MTKEKKTVAGKPRMLSLEELRELAGVSKPTIERHAAKGAVKVVNLAGPGTSRRVPPDEVARYLGYDPFNDKKKG